VESLAYWPFSIAQSGAADCSTSEVRISVDAGLTRNLEIGGKQRGDGARVP
jgi:hypothetical protein